MVKIGRFSVVWISVVPRDKKSYWVYPLQVFLGYVKLFNKDSSGLCCHFFIIFSVVKIRVNPRGIGYHWANPLRVFVFHIKVVGDFFVFVNK